MDDLTEYLAELGFADITPEKEEKENAYQQALKRKKKEIFKAYYDGKITREDVLNMLQSKKPDEHIGEEK